MKNLRLAGALCVAIAGTIAGAMSPASAETNIRVGTLRCDVKGGIGLVITSKKDMLCSFRPVNGGSERYVGTIRKFGIDIGATDRAMIGWAVFAPSKGRAKGALAGSYVGATGEATLGVGVGANVLVGGFHRSLTLQPLSLGVQQGINVAAGVADLELRSVH
ncbi:DUF992 domain-containing protein [Candidatus Raskinella chloraquaticus]|uniref:DUF992 domain-containing protein n=1 Tax=Candidatus Raskinella chloraquaticus TaxID=1951219 RepID=A0A1W9HPS1_9HYPH|nr:MAG: hypothetical protein A4S15_01470 [Proteobacteria bacterium SG_bin8]